jgi:ubiquinone/menaquinone biosynthesis C-methylase UbiE
LIRRPVQRFFGDRAYGWDENTHAGSVAHLAALAAAVVHVKPLPERILDVGTGTGEGALFLAREFPAASVRGVDLSEEMVRVAQGKIGLDPSGRVAFRAVDAAELPYEEASFDLVTLLNVPPFFGEIARVLRPGGYVVVAASHGPATPFYTPHSVLERGFRRHGVGRLLEGAAANGSYWIGRRRAR